MKMHKALLVNQIKLKIPYFRPTDLNKVLLLAVAFPFANVSVMCVEQCVSFHPDRQSGKVPLSLFCSLLHPLLITFAIFLAHAENHVS